MQLGPALSPDGKQAVFFSERDRLSMDLFLADVPTGRIVRKLATTAASARFDSLQALRSSGAWSPDGDWFVFPAVRQGHAALMLIAMQRGWAGPRVRLQGAGAGSLADLVSGRNVHRLLGPCRWLHRPVHVRALHAHAAAAHRRSVRRPAAGVVARWPHDRVRHRTLLERCSRRCSSAARSWRSWTSTRETVRRVDVGGSHAQLSPQWSRDDEELYFVGDTDGTANVYRVGAGFIGARTADRR